MKNDKKIKRGQVYNAQLDPVMGSEQGGRRPVLIIQNNKGNHHAPTVIIAPITAQVKSAYIPTHVTVPAGDVLPEDSMILLEQMRTIDKSRLGDCLGALDSTLMDRVDFGAAVSLALNRKMKREGSHE